MKTIFVLNAMQKDFNEQLQDVFACYMKCLADTSLSILLFSAQDKKEKTQELLFNFCASFNNTIEEITIINIQQNNLELQLDALSAYRDKMESCSYIFPSNLWAKSLCSRFAHRIHAASIHNIIDLHLTENSCKVRKFAYANNCVAEFEASANVYCFTLAKDAFVYEPDMFELEQGTFEQTTHTVRYLDWDKAFDGMQEVEFVEKISSTALNCAKFIVICGQGIDSKEKVQEIRKLAESIGAEFGVTRPVAMNAHESIERIVGISGNICKADICISIGTSGAGAYYAGIEKCLQIIAVNTDENAAIMEKADIAINEDGLQFMQNLVKIVHNSNNSNKSS